MKNIILIVLVSLGVGACAQTPKVPMDVPPAEHPTEKMSPPAEVSASTKKEQDPRLARANADLAKRKLKLISFDICDRSVFFGSVRRTPRIGGADLSDVVSTDIALKSGGTEMNPLFSWAGDSAPAAAFASKYLMKGALSYAGLEDHKVNQYIESAGAVGACNNLLVASVASVQPAVALGLGLGCGIFQFNRLGRQYERELEECGVTNVAPELEP